MSEQFPREAEIERVENPDPDTEERRDAAETIAELWDTDATFTDIADESGYSRQHIVNTLHSHFRIVDHDNGAKATDELVIQIPCDVDRESYVRGVFEGYMKA